MVSQPSLDAASAAIFVATMLLVATACSGTPDPRGHWRDWNTLRLEANASPLLHGEFEMRRTLRDGVPALETSASATVLGQRLEDTRTVTLFDDQGRTLRYARQSRRSGRRFVFGPESYTVDTLQPPRDGSLPLDLWQVSSSHEFHYPVSVGDGPSPQVFDYFGMLLALRHSGLDRPGDEATLHVATANGPRAFRISVTESREGPRTYTDLGTGDELTVHLREFRLRILPADPAQAGEGFLRMEGETEIWVEAESKTPLEISGKLPRVPGRVVLRLVAMG
jgi:hypothetical protein